MGNIELSGIELDVDELSVLWDRVVVDFLKAPRSRTFLNCYIQHPQLAEHTVKAIRRSISITAEPGKIFLRELKDETRDFSRYYTDYLSCPIAFVSFEMWAIIQVVQEAELAFIEVCSKKNIEVQLSGHLIQLLASKADLVQLRYEKYFAASGAQLNVQKLELQVKKREKKTGGDFALLFEWKDVQGTLKVCPVIFQAKRTDAIDVDISQSNTESGPQVAVLAKSKCNPSFIFYHCDSQNDLPEPRFATVKSVASVMSEGSLSKTSAVHDSLSLSVFILDILSSGNYVVMDSRKAALNAILPYAESSELSEIITFGSDSTAILEYQQEYKRYLTRRKQLTSMFGNNK
ncbi:hypothetical protein [Pseudomonas sp. DR208]|jgi:hypothetical protein|uniref:hypothetical protein n=1 Tax=Pseudomonas sp. DR208 TaxID=2870840 RepID=UPI001C98E5F1|nr:hypothetical protein [Pseudomonas sp. DR208]QZP19546.1 hypothetical protein K5K89_19730 [Pseudomonas sp. DR208]